MKDERIDDLFYVTEDEDDDKYSYCDDEDCGEPLSELEERAWWSNVGYDEIRSFNARRY